MKKTTKKSKDTPKIELTGKMISFICSIAAVIMCLLALVIKFFARENIDIVWFILLLSNISILFANINIAKIKK